jgi:hypothetical protein
MSTALSGSVLAAEGAPVERGRLLRPCADPLEKGLIELRDRPLHDAPAGDGTQGVPLFDSLGSERGRRGVCHGPGAAGPANADGRQPLERD